MAIPTDAGKRRSGSLIGCELFAGLSRERLAKLEQRCRFRRVARKARLVDYGDTTADVMFVLHGRVRVTIRPSAGREVIFRDFGPGDFFGELAAIDGEPRSAAVVAVVESVLAIMPATVFWDALRHDPSVAEALIKRLARSVRRLTERVLEFSTQGVRNRIHAELLRLARDSGQAGPAVTLAPPPTHEEIASRISTHREAVTREIGNLARSGLLERHRNNLVISNIGELERLVREINREQY